MYPFQIKDKHSKTRLYWIKNIKIQLHVMITSTKQQNAIL